MSRDPIPSPPGARRGFRRPPSAPRDPWGRLRQKVCEHPREVLQCVNHAHDAGWIRRAGVGQRGAVARSGPEPIPRTGQLQGTDTQGRIRADMTGGGRDGVVQATARSGIVAILHVRAQFSPRPWCWKRPARPELRRPQSERAPLPRRLVGQTRQVREQGRQILRGVEHAQNDGRGRCWIINQQQAVARDRPEATGLGQPLGSAPTEARPFGEPLAGGQNRCQEPFSRRRCAPCGRASSR